MPRSSRRKTTGSARRKAKREREAQRQEQETPLPVQPTPSPQPTPVETQEKPDPETQPLATMTQDIADIRSDDPVPATPQEQLSVDVSSRLTETPKEISSKVKTPDSDVSNFMAPATIKKQLRKDDPFLLLKNPPTLTYDNFLEIRDQKLAQARRYFGLPRDPHARIREEEVPKRRFFDENEDVILKALDDDNLDALVEEMIRVLSIQDQEEEVSQSTPRVHNSMANQPSGSMDDSDIMAITRSYYNDRHSVPPVVPLFPPFLWGRGPISAIQIGWK